MTTFRVAQPMKTFHLVLTAFLVITCRYSFAQRADSLEQEWVQNDINLVKSIEAINKNDAAAMERFFLQFDQKKQPDTLGFGWTLLSLGKGAGYIGVKADFYHYQGKIISYRLYSHATEHKQLKERYRKMLANLLPVDSAGFYYYKYREEELLKPLPQYAKAPGKHIPTWHLPLMSPTAGIVYAVSGGLPPTEFYNRRLFKEKKHELTSDDVTALMYAINPATRLMAFEYYLRHKNQFTNPGRIEAWMKTVYQNKPIIETVSGCFILYERAEKLVNFFSKIDMEKK